MNTPWWCSSRLLSFVLASNRNGPSVEGRFMMNVVLHSKRKSGSHTYLLAIYETRVSGHLFFVDRVFVSGSRRVFDDVFDHRAPWALDLSSVEVGDGHS